MFQFRTSSFHQTNSAFLIALTVVLLAGCAKSYVDPTFREFQYADINRKQPPKTAAIRAEFQRNGKNNEKLSGLLQKKVERFFNATGTFSQDESSQALVIVVNNVGNISSAAAKGVGTGLTFGLVGSMVVDSYVMTTNYTPESDDKMQFTKEYHHAIHSTIGNKAGPEGLEPLSVQEAFDTVLEDMLLNFVGDLQSQGYL